MKHSLVIGLLCFGFGSCDPRLPSEPELQVDFEDYCLHLTPLDSAAMTRMNGVYEAVQGGGVYGSPVVGRWIGNRWCLYSQHDVVFSVFAGGSRNDSTVGLRGYTRMVRSGSGTRAELGISSTEGGRELIAGTVPPLVRIRGTADDGTLIDLVRVRSCDTSHFEVLAHRGGGRNSDRLGISENSIEMIRFAGFLGATGVEIDVKRTRDGQLILFHDDTFSPRTVQGTYLLGRIEEYDLDRIRSLGRLVNGEQIPTLTEALTAIIDDTELSLVWLDVKDPEAVAEVVHILKDMMAYAAARQRANVSLLLGIPTQQVLNAYIPFEDSVDALVELEASTAVSLPRCRVWAPAWTRNIDPGAVSMVRANSKRVFTWTVDLRESMVNFLGRIDGILTNYPSLLTAIHDSRN